MSRLPPIPDPLDCVLFDAGDTLLAPAPSFQGRFMAVAAEHGLPLEEAAVDAAIADAVRAAAWPSDWTDPATQRSFWVDFYRQVLAGLGHQGPEGSGEPQGGAPAHEELAEGVDVVIVTHSPHEIQVERLAAKGVGERDASNRIAAQLEPEKRLARADIVIDNSGSLEKLGRRVDEVWEELQGLLAARAGGPEGGRRS